MKQTRVKLALLGAAAVAIAMIAATAAFNLFTSWKVEAEAIGDIEYALDLGDGVGGAGRTPNYVFLDSSYHIEAEMRLFSSDEETKLAVWFSEHPAEGVVDRVFLDNWSCYAAIMPYEGSDRYRAEFGYGEYGHDSAGYVIAYIDTAAEQSLVASVNAAFAIIALVGVVVAAVSGYVAGRRIEDAQAAQKRFYENMSHDLKTPLSAIRGYAEGASSGVVDYKMAAAAIVKETKRMTETIDEILGLSRLEAHAVEPKKESLEVGDFVQDCLMPLEGSVRAKGIDVQLDLADGKVEADPALFDHALSNVLTNAIRHAESRICVSYDGTTLAVWNDGNVPPESQLPHLFDRFYSGEGGSTGIGLAIAREIATLHGWAISAHVKDKGLEIAFTL